MARAHCAVSVGMGTTDRVVSFKGNNNCEKDRAVEDDVVDRVEKFRKDDGIELTVIVKWPFKYSNHAIVENSNNSEENIKT